MPRKGESFGRQRPRGPEESADGAKVEGFCETPRGCVRLLVMRRGRMVEEGRGVGGGGCGAAVWGSRRRGRL